MHEAVLVSACRTAIGAFNGSLKETTATDLGKIAILEAIRRAGVDQGIVDEVIMGCVLPAGLGQNPARQAMLKAGLDVMVGAITVNKVCGSGLKAVMLAAQAIQTGDAQVIVAGGMENMNLAPYYLLKGRYGERMGHGQVFDSMIYDGLWDHLNGFLMGVSAELCAEKYGVTRTDQDNFAFTSYQRALAAQAAGVFAAEITPVKLVSRKGEVDFVQDEVVKPTSLEDLAKLRPAFKKDGTVTPGNASKISDGGAAVVVMSADKARSLGLKPLARVVAQASAGIDPKYVLVAPIYAIPKCCAKAGLKPQDVDVYEINQAFSASSVAVQRHLDLDPEKIDVHGGAVALGHPIGASGARVLVSLLSAMKAKGAKTGLATLCLGGGEAVAMLIEAC